MLASTSTTSALLSQSLLSWRSSIPSSPRARARQCLLASPLSRRVYPHCGSSLPNHRRQSVGLARKSVRAGSPGTPSSSPSRRSSWAAPARPSPGRSCRPATRRLHRLRHGLSRYARSSRGMRGLPPSQPSLRPRRARHRRRARPQLALAHQRRHLRCHRLAGPLRRPPHPAPRQHRSHRPPRRSCRPPPGKSRPRSSRGRP